MCVMVSAREKKATRKIEADSIYIRSDCMLIQNNWTIFDIFTHTKKEKSSFDVNGCAL